MKNIQSFRELKVWQLAMEAAMEIFELTKRFPAEERYSLTDQIRRSSRSVAANISESWRKRRYPAAFVSKLNDAEAEAAETQTHIEIALRCGYFSGEQAQRMDHQYEQILSMLVAMANRPDDWAIVRRRGDGENVSSNSDFPASPRPLVPSSAAPPSASVSVSPSLNTPASPS